ncbi:dephospho-CoA kinase [Acetobacteraceae bacterium KSS8]|uniref:Dephospho-CoA kinase n=1 Tax=Endosaccharibacter trunci TaxID=2812733 RepID=A0ABT1W422_9PROT|nr:dephospho-CoA kinase [Acetobacteraceae bacterium KSS8]
MKIIGLTGGIGMGKSTVASALRRAGLPVFDADRTVHRLQAPGGAAVAPIARLVPEAVREGRIDRAALRRAVIGRPEMMRALERIIHPLVRDAEKRFLRRAQAAGHRWAVLDIPLLLENGGERRCDHVIVVSAPAALQRARVARRRGMSAAEADHIIAAQMPDREKRRRADTVIRTGLSRYHSLRQLRRLLARLRVGDARS